MDDTSAAIHLEGFLFQPAFLHCRKVWCELREGYMFVFPSKPRDDAHPQVIMLENAVVWHQRGDTHFALESLNARGVHRVDEFTANPAVARRWVETILEAQAARRLEHTILTPRDLVKRPATSTKPPPAAHPATKRRPRVIDRLKNFVHRILLPRDTKKVCTPSKGDPAALLERLKHLSILDSKRPGEVSMDDFRVQSLIGSGTHGAVYKVVHIGTGVCYALKVIAKEHIRRPSSFFVELYVLRTLRHPFVVRHITAFQTDQRVAILLNYLPNGTLSERLERGRGLPVDAVRRYAAQILTAIAYLHGRGVVYRDVKPENIVLNERDECVLTDMSLARRNTLCFTICGTPLYVAPEVLLRDGYTKDVDWWGFGVVLYELLVGATPFAASTTNAIFENILTKDVAFPYGVDLPGDARDLIRALLRKNPVNRLTDPAEMRWHPFFASVDWKAMPAV